MERYLICFPQGGINDMFSRIQTCIHYCISEKRILILDTGKNWFRDDWRAYFSIDIDLVYKGDTPEMITFLLSQDVYPLSFQHKTYQELTHAKWIKPGHMEMNGICTSTSLRHSYPNQTVIYAECGSSVHINPILHSISFTSMIKTEFQKRKSILPDEYISIHIRNTDYQSDVEDFFTTHDEIFKSNPIFIASDHASTIEACKARYNQVYSFSTIPFLPDKTNIHESELSQSLRNTKEEIRMFNMDAFIDFLLLAHGTHFFYSSKQSGFSRSISFLREDRVLVKRLV